MESTSIFRDEAEKMLMQTLWVAAQMSSDKKTALYIACMGVSATLYKKMFDLLCQECYKCGMLECEQ